MTQQVRTLKYGDVLRIHGLKRSQKDNERGVMLSKGFTDPNLYFMKYSDFGDINLYRETLFQVIPQTSFHIHNELLKDGLDEKEVETIKIRAASEVDTLYSNFEARIGTQVLYGAPILFRHVETGHFLRGVLQAANSGEGSFKLNLTDQLSSYLGFKIRSHRSYERDGDKVYLDDPLQIYHVSTDCYMNFDERDQLIFLDVTYNEPIALDPQDKAYQYLNAHPNIKKSQLPRIEVVNQNKAKCLWKFILHEDCESHKTTNIIKPHDIVYLEHTKIGNKGVIAASLTLPEVYLKENVQGRESSFYDALWETIPLECNQYGPEQSEKYYLRSVTCGLFLVHSQDIGLYLGEAGEGERVILSPQESQEADSKEIYNYRLVNLLVGEKKVDRGARLPEDEASLPSIVNYYNKKRALYNLELVQEMIEHSFVIKKPSKQQLQDVLFVLASLESINKFCQMLKIKETEEPPTREYYAQLMERCTDSVLQHVIFTFKALIGHIYRCEQSEIDLPGKKADQQIQRIMVQVGLAELTIETIYYLAAHYREIGPETGEYRSQKSKMMEIFAQAYKLLGKMAISYEDNRIYISRWVELIMLHSYNINRQCVQECLVGILDNNQISIEATINKEKIKDLVVMFKKEAEEDFPKTKYLRLLSTFIKCSDNILKSNQENIIKYFFQDETNRFRFKFRGYAKANQVDEEVEGASEITKLGQAHELHISYGGKGDYISLGTFFRDYDRLWNYFLEYVNLMADVCMGRNSQSIEAVSQWLTLRNVLIVLADTKVTTLHESICSKNKGKSPPPYGNVYEPFIRIAHHVYVDIKKFEPIKRISKIKYWGELEPDEDITRTKRVFQGQKEEEEKKYLGMILDLIQRFLKNAKQNPDDVAQMKALYTTLDLLKVTVTLGLWQTVTQFHELIPPLFMKIMKLDQNYLMTHDVKDPKSIKEKQTLKNIILANKELVQPNTPEMTLIIDCKKKAAEILRLMMEMENNIRVSSLTRFFKGLYEATENFELYEKDEEVQYEMSKKEEDRNEAAKEYFKKLEEREDILNFIGVRKRRAAKPEILLIEKIWLNKLKELTPTGPEAETESKRYLFNRIPNFQELVLSLLELSQHQDDKVLNSSMMMSRLIFGQREDLISNFKNVVLCSKGSLLDITHKFRMVKHKLSILTDPEIKDFSNTTTICQQYDCEIWKPYDHTTKDESKRSGIIQDLFYLGRIIKQSINLKNTEALMTVDDNDLARKNPHSEIQFNDKLIQNVALVQAVHEPLFDYIKFIGEIDKDELPLQHKNLLIAIYQYLTLLVWNNLENKQHLMNYVPDVLPHLGLGVGASTFVYEICNNNKLLVNDEKLSSLIIDKVVNATAELHITDYEKGRVLFCLRGLIVLNDKGHDRNQKEAVNKLQKRRESVLFNESLRDMHITPRAHDLDFNLSPQQTYMATMFEILSAIVQSKNLTNVGKLSNIYTSSYLISCLHQATHWQTRRAVRSFLNRLYYVHDQENLFLSEEFIREQWQIIANELSQLVHLYVNYAHETNEVSNSFRFTYAGSHTYLVLFEIIVSLHSMLSRESFVHLLLKQLRKDKNNQTKLREHIIEVGKSLGYIIHNRYIYPNKMPGSYLDAIRKLMIPILRSFDLDYLENACGKEVIEDDAPDDNGEGDNTKRGYDYSKSFFRNLYEMIYAINRKKRRDLIKQQFNNRKHAMGDGNLETKKDRFIDMIFSGKLAEHRASGNRGTLTSAAAIPGRDKKKQIISQNDVEKREYETAFMTSVSRHFNLLAKPTLSQNEENLELNKKLQQVKYLLAYSPIFQKAIDEEFYRFVSYFTTLNQTSSAYYEKYIQLKFKLSGYDQPVVSLEDVISNMFRLTMNNPQEIDDNHKIVIIKLMRCYMSEAFQNKQEYKLPVDKWDVEYVGEDKAASKEFESRQALIEKCGGANFIWSILKDLGENLDNRLALFNEVLLLGIVFLFGGNPQCQNSLLNTLKKDVENEMLSNLNGLIKKIGNFIYETNKVKGPSASTSSSSKAVTWITEDNFDYYNDMERMLERKNVWNYEDKVETRIKQEHESALCRSFRFLQLFCENNNVDMKNFLLVQTNEDGSKKTKTINFIETSTLLLRKLFKMMSSKISQIPEALLDFVNEVTQIPCLDNQISLTKSSYFEDLCYMASLFAKPRKKSTPADQDEDQEITDKETLDALFGIYNKSIQLALSNLQGNDDRIYSEFIAKCEPTFLWIVVRRNLLFKLVQYNKNNKLQLTLLDFDRNHLLIMLEQEYAKMKKFDDAIVNILNIFIILTKIKDFETRKREQSIQDSENVDKEAINAAKNASNFRTKFEEVGGSEYEHMRDFMGIFQSLLLQIQVCTENGGKKNIQNIYFPCYPVFEYLPGETRDRIMNQVPRDTTRDKLIGILGYKDEIFKQIEWIYKLRYNHFTILGRQIPFEITSKMCTRLRYCAIGVSCITILLMLVTMYADHFAEEQIVEFAYTSFASAVLMRSLALLQLLITCSYLGVWITLRSKLALAKEYPETDQEDAPAEDVNNQEQSRLTRWLKKLKNSWLGEKLKPSFSLIWAIARQQSEFLSMVLFLLCSLLGNIVGPEYFTVHLLDIFLQIPILGNVFKSITKNTSTLAVLSLLATMFIFVFNVLSFPTYASTIYPDDLPDEVCTGLYACVMTLYTSGAIGDEMEEFEPYRFAFDLLYVVFMELLFQNLVGGIMIDTFQSLREENNQINQDKANKCFICGKEKMTIEKQGKTFPDHISRHFLWNYVYYIYCLDEKDPTDYSGAQYEITSKIEKEDVSWFPGGTIDEGQGTEEKFSQILNLIQQIKSKANDNSTNFTSVVERSSMFLKDDRVTSKAIMPA